MEYGAPIKQDILAYTGQRVEISVSETDTAYSSAFVLEKNVHFGVEYQFLSDTDVNVKVELEQANGTASADYASTTTLDAGCDDEDVHIVPVSPVVSVYARIKFTGLAGNSSTTRVVRLNWVTVKNG